MIPNFHSDALRRVALGSARTSDISTDALGRAAYRADQNRANATVLAPPAIDTKGMDPALAGRLAGGTPNYRDPGAVRHHLQFGTNPYQGR